MEPRAQQSLKQRTIDLTGLPEDVIRAMESLVSLLREQSAPTDRRFPSHEEWSKAFREWAESHRLDAAKVVSPYFRQDEKLVQYVLTRPPDRVSYRMLTPKDDELQRIADMAFESGILERHLDIRGLVDREFIPTDITPAKIEVQ